jgi:hypothetical protein
VVLSLPRLFQIAGQDEVVHYVGLGQRLYEQGFSRPGELIAFSPHLYGFAIALAHHLGGPGVPAARLPGVAAWILTALVLWWWLARQARPGAVASAGWMLALLVTTPLALQAAAIVDIDNTILVPAVLALCLAVSRFVAQPGRVSGLLVIVLFAAALWCRITTPTVLIPAFLLYAWWAGRQGRTPAAASPAPSLAFVLALGGALFLLTWWGYCQATAVNFTGPFRYLVNSLIFCTVGADRGMRPGKIALTLAYVLLWAGPALAVLWALLGVERLRRLWRTRCVEPADLFLLAGATVLGGYCLVGGTIFGFPKYHCPALPLLLIALAGTFGMALQPVGRAGGLTALGLLLVGAVLQVQVLGDPLLLLRLDLREAVFHGEGSRHLLWAGLVRPVLLTTALAGLLLAALCRRRLLTLPCALLCLGLGMNAGLVGLQQFGGYQTGYNYGDSGDARATVELLAAWLPVGAAAIVPGELVYLLNRPAVTHVPNELWTDAAGLRRELARPEVAAAASSLLTNTMVQLNALIAVASSLPDYQRVDVGLYVVFLRRLPP